MLGASIRAKRLAKEMSLRDVAEKTGLTASFLSQVERDLAEPSITSLRKIAEALGVPIFYFLLDTADQSPVVRSDSRKGLRLPESKLTYELLSPDLNRKIEMVMGRLAEGGATCDVPLTHPGEQCILVLEGQARVDVGTNGYYLNAGDSAYSLGSTPHRVLNVGSGELVFVMAITPPVF